MSCKTYVDKYFGCDCFCLNHISHFSYFPPKINEDEEDNIIYLTVKSDYLYRNIMPPIDPRDLEYYFRFHILRRIPIALCHIFNKYYYRKHGVMDCFDFREEDLLEIKEFLSNLTDEESVDVGELDKEDMVNYIAKIIDKYVFNLENDHLRLGFSIWRLDKDLPWYLGWDIQFRQKKIFKRFLQASKYIFGKVSDEQCFEINEESAKKIKGLITVVGKLNDERTKSKN